MVSISISTDGILPPILQRAGNWGPLLDQIGLYLVSQTLRHFALGGPGWKPLKPSTVAHRRKGSAVPLRDTGRLMNSIAHKVEGNKVKVGTNVEYASTHQFGARKGQYGTKTMVQHVREHVRRRKGASERVRAHERRRTIQIPWGDVPARPFLYITADDIRTMEEIVREYLVS